MLHTIFQAFSPDVLENLTARAFVVCEGAHKGVESKIWKEKCATAINLNEICNYAFV